VSDRPAARNAIREAGIPTAAAASGDTGILPPLAKITAAFIRTPTNATLDPAKPPLAARAQSSIAIDPRLRRGATIRTCTTFSA
jgi:hypothetical protein